MDLLPSVSRLYIAGGRAGVAVISRQSVPDDLGELDRWGVWRLEKVKDRDAKVPYSARGLRADSTNPSHWGELEREMCALRSGK